MILGSFGSTEGVGRGNLQTVVVLIGRGITFRLDQRRNGTAGEVSGPVADYLVVMPMKRTRSFGWRMS